MAANRAVIEEITNSDPDMVCEPETGTGMVLPTKVKKTFTPVQTKDAVILTEETGSESAIKLAALLVKLRLSERCEAMSEFTNKNIWVFIETDEGKAKSVGLELLNPGRMLAEKSGEKLVAVVFGKDNAEAIEQVKDMDLIRLSVYPAVNMRNTALMHIPMQ